MRREEVTEAMRSMLATDRPYRPTALGTLVVLGGLAGLLLIMLPFRDHLSIATPALVFVIPVILGVVVGGPVPGVVGAVAGFVLYDYFFLPPYGNLTVRETDDWSALVVYVLVVLVVSRVVTNLQAARQEAHRREEDAGRLYELSQALIGDLSHSQLLEVIVATVQTVFTPRWTALLLPGSRTGTASDGPALTVAARAGQPLTDDDLASLIASAGQTRSLGLPGGDVPSRIAVALVASNRPVGMLVLQEVQFARQDRDLLGTFANQAALAVERAQLKDQATRTRLLEEIDRWRRAMMGAVSHDLRTPLASVKTAVSSLRRDGTAMGADDRAELLELIELQSDRLARLVTNLLDLTRIESGALALQSSPVPFDELVGEALDAVTGLVLPSRVAIEAAADLPLLEIDHVLIAQVLANLLENAVRLSPREAPITITAQAVPSTTGPVVEISVADDGPGIPLHERERVFEMFSANDGGGRAGLGLTIAKAFVEAHGGAIWIDPDVTSGARIVFTVPGAVEVPAHA
jgi:two-component system, OmpR family, sensor histidine kinase KdpD